MRISHIIIIMVMFGIMVVVNDHTQSRTHENIHRQIAIYNGCQDYEMDINWFSDSSFMCTYKVPTSPEMDLMEYQLDSQNEIVSYNINYLATVISMCTLLIVLTIILNKEG